MLIGYCYVRRYLNVADHQASPGPVVPGENHSPDGRVPANGADPERHCVRRRLSGADSMPGSSPF
jgi:hypothetical protein